MRTRIVPIALAGCLALAACGGGDDDGDSTTTTEAPTEEPAESVDSTTTTTAAPESTTTTTTTPELVVEGATVVVANASIVGGSAGRMTDELGQAGFTTAEATNSTERVTDSIVYYTDAEGAQAVAESVGVAMGGLEVRAMPDPIPTESGDLGDAQVLVLLGDNQADRTLEELSGAGAADEETDEADGESDESDESDEAGDATEAVETNGSTVVVANASGVSGSAGRMTDQLEQAGITVGEATNGVVQLADTVVHYTDAEGAQEDAETVATLLGGVEVEPMPDEIPTESSELDGEVLVLLGTNQADQALDSLNP